MGRLRQSKNRIGGRTELTASPARAAPFRGEVRIPKETVI